MAQTGRHRITPVKGGYQAYLVLISAESVCCRKNRLNPIRDAVNLSSRYWDSTSSGRMSRRRDSFSTATNSCWHAICANRRNYREGKAIGFEQLDQTLPYNGR